MRRLSEVLSPEDYQRVLQNEVKVADVPCCELCDLKAPMECWRSFLTGELQESYAECSRASSQFVKFEKWKKHLAAFVQKNGTHSSDQRWQLKFFNLTKQQTPRAKVFSVSQNEAALF